MDDPINQFFTLESMLTLTGATGATLVVSNALQQLLNRNPKWIALIVAQTVSLATVYYSGATLGSDYFIALINGFLIYSSAIGASVFSNGTSSSPTARSSTTVREENLETRTRRSFLAPWF